MICEKFSEDMYQSQQHIMALPALQTLWQHFCLLKPRQLFLFFLFPRLASVSQS